MSVKIKVVPRRGLWDRLDVEDLKRDIKDYIRGHQRIYDEVVVESETENTMSLFLHIYDTTGHIEVRPHETQFTYYHFSKWGAYFIKKIAENNNGSIIICKPVKVEKENRKVVGNR